MLTAESFRAEIGEALRNYDRHVVHIGKSGEEAMAVLASLIPKAIAIYEKLEPGQNHAYGLDHHLTVIISKTPKQPIIGIYYNLSSPFHGLADAKKKK